MPTTPMPVLWPGDVVFTRGDSLLGKAIRWATREGTEPPSQVNHVGMIVEPGLLPEAIIVEALQKVQRHSIGSKYFDQPKHQVAVFRPRILTRPEQDTLVTYAENMVGRTYGYEKIVLHGLRRFTKWSGVIDAAWSKVNLDRFPICSYLVARAYEQIGQSFGVDAALATPDDMWDYVSQNTDAWEPILWPLRRLTASDLMETL